MISSPLAIAPLLLAVRVLVALNSELSIASPVDEEPLTCSQLALNRSCFTHAEYMLAHCAATIATSCNTTGMINERDTAECDRWASAQQCELNPAFMLESCSASCAALLLRRHQAIRRQQVLAARLRAAPERLRDDDPSLCQSATAESCLSDDQRHTQLCAVTCLGGRGSLPLESTHGHFAISCPKR